MNNTEKLLRAFIEASGYEVEEVKTPCMPIESDGIFFGQDYKFDYKVTKEKAPYNSGVIGWGDMNNMEKIMILEQKISRLKNEKA